MEVWCMAHPWMTFFIALCAISVAGTAVQGVCNIIASLISLIVGVIDGAMRNGDKRTKTGLESTEANET